MEANGQINKPVGAEVWAGSTIELAAPSIFQPKK
jgi:hypothetical protein